MRTLLQHATTHLYFQWADRWTDDPELAVDFRFLDRALRYAQVWGLKEAEVAFALEAPARFAPALRREVSWRHTA